MRLAPRLVAAVTGAAALIATATAAFPAAPYDRPGTTQLISAARAGSAGNDDSGEDAMTPDGRYLAFSSTATDLVPGDTNGAQDVFVKDRLTGAVQRVSVASDGHQGIANPVLCGAPGATTPPPGATAPAISANGRYVAFVGCFDNLVAGPTSGLWLGDTNHSDDIFVHDRVSGRTTRVSVASDGQQAASGSGYPSISADGRYVAFASTATNLVNSACSSDPVAQVECASPGVIGNGHVYVHDIWTGKTTLVDASASGGRSNGVSYAPSISPDGHVVAFASTATDLIADDTNACPLKDNVPSCQDEFLRDLRTGTTELVSVGLDGHPANDSSGADELHVQAISADDRYVVFVSQATNLVPNSTGASGYGVYVRDRKNDRTERVSVDSTGRPLEAQTFSLSPDGRYVATASVTGLVCAKSNPGVIGVYDRTTGEMEAAGHTDYRNRPDCSHYYDSGGPQVSRGGRFVAFTANGKNHLVRTTTHGKTQVFVRDRGPDLGVGGLAGAGRLSIAGASSFGSTGVVTAVGTSRLDPVLSATGADLIEASVAYRPQSADLFFRLPVQQMPLFTLADPALVYGVNLTIHGARYQVRAAKTGPLTASFGLFRRGAGNIWTQVATLKGGYGTTGQEVVVALPLRDIGATRGGRLTHVRAFTGLGTFLTGATTVVDHVAIGAAS